MVKNTLRYWLRDESGHDLIEYALLAALIAAGSAAALGLMPGVMNAVYQSWNNGSQAIWDPCDPGAGTTCH